MGSSLERLLQRVPEETSPPVGPERRIPGTNILIRGDTSLQRVGGSNVFARRFSQDELDQQEGDRVARIRGALDQAQGMLRGDVPFPKELSREPVDQSEFIRDVGRSLATGQPAETRQGSAVAMAAENIPVIEQLVGLRDIGLGVAAGIKGNKAEGFLRGAAGIAGMLPILPSSARLIAPRRFAASRRMGIDEAGVPTIKHVDSEVSAQLDELSPTEFSEGKIPTLRDLDYDDAITFAREGQHLRRAADGHIVGAPAHVTDDVSLGLMRDEFDMHMARGWTGGTWYRRAREGHAGLVGPNQLRRNQLGTSEAVFSAGADPGVNLGFTVQAQGQFAAGDAIRAGRFPTAQSRKVERVLREGAGQEDVLALKTQPFAAGITPDDARVALPYGTNDIWHARSMGYTNPDGSMFDTGLSSQQHRFIDGETMLAAERANAVELGGRTDWTPEEAQAAIWISKKGESLAPRFGSVSRGIEEASKEYTENFPRFTSFATNEVIPGAATRSFENLDELLENPLLREQFHADELSSSVDEAGRDLLMDEARLLNQPPVESQGVFKNSVGEVEFNPATTVPVLNAREADAVLGKVVAHPDASVMDKVQAMRAYLDAQEAGAWHALPTIRQGAKPGATNAVRISGGDPAGTEALKNILETFGLEPIHTGDGFSLIPAFAFSTPLKGARLDRALKGKLGRELRSLFPDSSIERAVFDAERTGGYIDFAEEWAQGEGAVTRKLLELLDESPAHVGVTQRLEEGAAVPTIAARRLQRDENWGAALGGVRQDIQNAREVLANGGLPALRKALADGRIALPVLAGAFGIKHLAGDDDVSAR